MSYLRPAYKLELGSTELSSDTLGPMVALEVARALNGPGDGAVVRLGGKADSLPEAGDDATVELGWDGDTEAVFTGTVAWTEMALDFAEVVCVGTSMSLVNARSDEAFLDQSAGDIVTALASEAGLSTGSVESGVQLPVYLVDSTSNHFEHCLYLARLSGCDLYTTADGDLELTEFSAFVPDHLLRYGADVLEVRASGGHDVAGAKVVPESPSSTMGADSAPWLSKDSSTFAVSAGGSPETLTADPALRSKEAAVATASSLVASREREAVRGTVKVMGRPDVHPAEAVGFLGIDQLDGLYEVTAVAHFLDRTRGFRTLITFGGA